MTYILAINPGSTSTKISLYNGAEEVFTKTLRHSSEEIGGFDKVIDQFKFRETTIVAALEESGVKLEDLAAVVGQTTTTRNSSYIISKGTTSIIAKRKSYLVIPQG